MISGLQTWRVSKNEAKLFLFLHYLLDGKKYGGRLMIEIVLALQPPYSFPLPLQLPLEFPQPCLHY
jgi:hypothetical protein